MTAKRVFSSEVPPPSGAGEGIVLGMSGGVDSSVAARLLIEAGYEVLGVTFRIPGAGGTGAAGHDPPEQRAARVCRRLGIAHDTVDVAGIFERRVVAAFVEAYRGGATPNPCVTCNESVKFPSLAGYADARGIRRIATGHYARLVRSGGKTLLAMGSDHLKDQSYFLYRVPVSLLERSVFPLGSCRKSEVLEAAAEIGVDVEESAESQDICFIPGGGTQGFIESRIDTVPGEIIDESGRVLGRHGGIHRFTVGQRKGLGVAAGEPLYVSRIDADSGSVVLSGGDRLYSRAVVCSGLRMRERRPAPPLEARIRYRHPPAPIEAIEVSQGRCTVTFREAQRAPAPGQSLVLYRGAIVIGGGVISGAGA